MFACVSKIGIKYAQHLEGGNKGIKGRNGGGSSGSGDFTLLQSCRIVGLLNSPEKVSSGSLLLWRLRQGLGSSACLVHEAGEFVADFPPLLAFNVAWKLLKTLACLGKDGLLLGSNGRVVWLVKRSWSFRRVNRVWRVKWLRLVRSVSGTLRIGTAITKAEDRESWGFSYSGAGCGRDEGNTCGGSEGLSTRDLLYTQARTKHKFCQT